MKIYIVTDMEGAAGIMNHDDWVVPGGKHYEEGKMLLTGQANAAAKGFFVAGADEVCILDGHGTGGIEQKYLDKRTELIRGGGYPFGLDSSFDCMAWVGQHAKAGSVNAHIPHTGGFNLIDYKINGMSIGEYGQMAMLGAELGITPVFSSGDRALCLEAAELTPGIITVDVKYGLTEDDGSDCDTQRYKSHNLGCVSLQPEKACELIEEGAKNALLKFIENRNSFTLIKLNPPYRKDIIYRHTYGNYGYKAYAENCGTILELLKARDIVKGSEI